MGPFDAKITERAKLIRFVLLDVDGVLTDGRILLFSDGTEGRAFHVRDGLGIRLAQQKGIGFGLLSGRESKVVVERARQLGIAEVHQGVRNKEERFGEILARLALPPEAVCYVGDDVVDVPVLRRAGFAVVPADAAAEAVAAADWVTSRRGGEGAVRELVDMLLRARAEP